MKPLWEIAAEGALRLHSPIHGELHWNRVAATGLELVARTPGGDPLVVFAFGVLHDCRRVNDGRDPCHGDRAAQLARELHAAGALDLDPEQLTLLEDALRLHDTGATSTDATIGCCYDADRLQLQRLGRTLRPSLLSTAAALPLAGWARQTLNVFVDWPQLARDAGLSVQHGLAAPYG